MYIGPVQVWLQNMIHNVYGPVLCLYIKMTFLHHACMHANIGQDRYCVQWICIYIQKCKELYAIIKLYVIMTTNWYRRKFVPRFVPRSLFAAKGDLVGSIIATKGDPAGSLFTRINYCVTVH